MNIVKLIREDYAWERAACRAEGKHINWVLYAVVSGWWLAKVLYCKVFDHDIEDESYGGPDSGCMAGRCRRCGWSFHHTLY